MKGKVLGFDAASGTGAITGDDGQRYTFAAADFKSPPPPKPNDGVDFEVAAGAAKNIYVTKAAGAGVDLSAMAANPTMASILAKPNVIWAALVILGSLMAGYLSTLSFLGQIGGQTINTGILGSVSVPGMGIGALFFALLFAIPVLAIVLIVFEFMGNPLTTLFRLITGAAAAAGPIVLPMLGGMMIGGGRGGINVFDMGMLFGGGTYTLGLIMTIAGGVLILLTHFGIIKKLG